MFVLLVLHLVVGIAIVAGGRILGRRAFALAAVPPLAMLVWAAVQAPTVLDGEPVSESFAWIPRLGISIDLRLDAFSLLMVAVVSGVGLLICVYSLGYFSHDGPGLARLAGVLVLFAGAMLGVVLSDQLIALFIFWELTSITSFLLIGNDDTSPRARAAAPRPPASARRHPPRAPPRAPPRTARRSRRARARATPPRRAARPSPATPRRSPSRAAAPAARAAEERPPAPPAHAA